ncbi:putative Protein kinase [Leptomonas seymouri]|uniref:Protein kinase domain-containing protein n=1 Tax=Leptomonas seymouri TaxID=5684 RepID=A0A0N1PFR7_LEPSE|nr:putative Protein kinase [Leptomonas seymouri]|eukprot:KPI89183.1 putative Protein kinase [Leptomonas seymouri]
MGCNVSMSSREAQHQGCIPSKSEVSSHWSSCPGAQPQHNGIVDSSPVVNTSAQPHLTPGSTDNMAPDEQIAATASEASPTEQGSSRLSFSQPRLTMLRRSSTADPMRPLSGAYLRNATSPAISDVASKQATSSPLSPHSQQQQQQQQGEGRTKNKQHRLCKLGPVRPAHPLSPGDSLTAPSCGLACVEQQQQWQPVDGESTSSTTIRRRSLASTQEPQSQPVSQLSHRRTSGSTAHKSNPKVKTSPAASPGSAVDSPTGNVLQMDAVAFLGVDAEYLGNGSHFDIDSTNGGRGDSASSPSHLHITLPPTLPDRAEDVHVGEVQCHAVEQEVVLPIVSPSLPPVVSLNSFGTQSREGKLHGNGDVGLRLRQVTQSVSLVSLTETSDEIFIPSSPHSTVDDRLDSVPPVFNGLALNTGIRPWSSCTVGASRSGRVDQANGNGLATFCNQLRECVHCKSPAVAFACELCEDFFLCENCRFDVELVRNIHDPTHAMLTIQDNHCSSSRTFGGDSIFSLSGESGANSLFNPPCTRCERVIDDTEPVYRCEQCDYVLCEECFFKPREQVDMKVDSPHEHVLKRFQRKSKSGAIHGGAVVSKTRNSGGNRVINDYVVVRLLGQGSYAKVKLVQHIRTQELFALKILKKQRKGTISGMNLGRSRVKLASTGVSEDDLLREIAVMKFIDHPNITKLKEVIEDVEAQKVYVIMEYCENGPVHVLGDPPLALEQVRQYGADIMRGLLHLHSEFLYHRDIKPANCLVNHEFVVKIADFGTCNSQIRTRSSEGTLAFSCPEQARGEEVSGEVVDSWAFALTLYEMACGTLPVSTTSLLQYRNTLLGPEPIPLPEDGDLQLRSLLASMLDKDLKSRMLLSAAARHPFFAACCIDPHGVPQNAGQIATLKQMQAQQLSSSSPHSSLSPHGEQQRKALTELYNKGLESVYRGKNLKDCFHGVRALRRIQRKEADTVRNGSEAVGAHGDYDDCMGYYFDEDEDISGVLHSRDIDLNSPMPSQSRYGYGSSSPSGSANDEANYDERRGVNLSSSSKDAEESTAVIAVEEIVQDYLSSKKPKVEVTYVNLSRQSTLERLNQLPTTVTGLRLGHNALTSTAGLRFNVFSMLKDISIVFNRLDAFPENILFAPRLVRLDLSHNRILSIPPTLVTRAPFLERLNLHHNCITQVDAVPCTSSMTVSPSLTSFPSPESGAHVANTRSSPATPPAAAADVGAAHSSDTKMVSVLAAPCLRHVRLSGNPLESLPLALETTNRLELVLDAIPALMEQWHAYTQMQTTTTKDTAAPAKVNLSTAITSPSPLKNRLPAVIVWDDSFPVRIPDVEPAVWLAVNNMAVYRVQTLRTCRTRRVVLCQCADPRFPNGVFGSADMEAYFAELSKVLQEQRQEQEQEQEQPNGSADIVSVRNEVVSGALPPIVGRAARSYVESYFFVTDDGNEEDGGYHNLVEYLNDALAMKEPVLVVVVTSGNASAARTNIVAALSTYLTKLRGKDLDDVSEQAELVVSTMRSLYA